MPTVLPIDDSDARYPIHSHRRLLGERGPGVFPVALGGNAFGWTASEEASYEALETYHALGGNLIVTEDSAASGRSEIIVGDWMRSRAIRSDIIVAAKIGTSSSHPPLSSRSVSGQIHASLTRLRTDYIDVVFLPVDDDSSSLDEILVAVDESVRRGEVGAVGAVGHSANRILEARIIAAQLGLAPLTVLQARYNLMHRNEFEHALESVAAQQSLGVIPSFALDGGFLAGNYRSKSELDLNSTGNIVLGGDAQSHLNRRGLRVLAAVDRIAREHDCAAATIALAWLLSKSTVTAPVVGVSNAAQVADLVAAADIALTRQQVALLDRVSASRAS